MHPRTHSTAHRCVHSYLPKEVTVMDEWSRGSFRNLQEHLSIHCQLVASLREKGIRFMCLCFPQGRVGLFFDDRNETLVDGLISEFPDVVSLEMETFHLLDLARVSKGKLLFIHSRDESGVLKVW